VGWNAVVLHRELQGLGFTGGVQHVRRTIRPWRADARWAVVATVRYETGPGEQAQVDFGQLRIWLGERSERVHLFSADVGLFAATVGPGLSALAAECAARRP
jgi:transposase